MKKIQSLFKRDYEGTRQVFDDVVDGSEWVLAGEGLSTEKFDGTACLVRDGKLYRRFDRKVTKYAKKRGGPFEADDCKPAPAGWDACEPEPNAHTGHWPGWLPVGDGPNDKWHREAWENSNVRTSADHLASDVTYELVGPKVQGNPYDLDRHELWLHGSIRNIVFDGGPWNFKCVKASLAEANIEGIVWHHPDGRMVKIKRKDFGLPWPLNPPEKKHKPINAPNGNIQHVKPLVKD